MKKYIIIAFAALAAVSCNLFEAPITQVSKETIFSSEAGIKTYANSFYDMLPAGTAHAQADEDLVDFACTKQPNAYILKGQYDANKAGGWSWTSLRNVNYFIDNCTNPAVPQDVRTHYLAVARFFRAYFYTQRVKTFGDVPWVEHPIDYKDTATLYAPRDKRAVVMEHVWNDLMFACENLNRDEKDATYTYVNKWVAYSFAARIALREGTYIKYHGLDVAGHTSAEKWFERAATCAKYVMDYGGKGLASNYRNIFTGDNPVASEAIWVIASSVDLKIVHAANVVYNNSTNYKASNMIRPFINTYLRLDGTPYTNKEGWQTETWAQECVGRDARLAATIRTPQYKREGESSSLPKWSGYATIGYQPIKLCVDKAGMEASGASAINSNVLYIIRYPEVLLTYAEAKAELGELTDDDWAKTVGALRKRAGITGGLLAKPTVVDTYLQENFFPTISDPVILEIRRERGIELAYEGVRYDDLMRWHAGDLLVKFPYGGVNIEKLDALVDMSGNGEPDAIFYTSKTALNAAKTANPGVDWNAIDQVEVSEDTASAGTQVHKVSVGGKTVYQLVRNFQRRSEMVWGEKQYLHPIPATALVDNPRLGQNPGWENDATNDGN